jgi:hypothetical protein
MVLGFLMTDALANERTARHLMAIGEVSAAEPYFREACSSYEKWGGEVDSIYCIAPIETYYT